MLLVIDGIDAVGKSTVCEEIKRRKSAALFGEFSEAPLGALITKIVQENRFFRLSGDLRAPLADLFCILSDACLKYETASAKLQDGLGVMERGIYSAIAYQFVRASDVYSFENLKSLHDALVQVLFTWHEPISTAKHINLTLSRAVLVDRIAFRGESALNESQLSRLLNIQEWMLRLSSAHGAATLDVSDLCLEQVLTQIDRLILSWENTPSAG